MTEERDTQAKFEIRDGMRIDWDAPIPMDDGIVLRADVFRPVGEGRDSRVAHIRALCQGTRFSGRLSGRLGNHGARTSRCSRRAQPISIKTGKLWTLKNGCRTVTLACAWTAEVADAHRVTLIPFRRARRATSRHVSHGPASNRGAMARLGLNGISYYGINQWQVASLQPQHLAAMCVWEGAAEWYRDTSHHGGIYCTFWENWYDMQVKTVQHGLGTRGPRSRATGDLVCGPETLTEAELAANRCNFGADLLAHPLDDPLQQGSLARLVQDNRAASFRRELGRPGTASARQF